MKLIYLESIYFYLLTHMRVSHLGHLTPATSDGYSVLAFSNLMTRFSLTKGSGLHVELLFFIGASP